MHLTGTTSYLFFFSHFNHHLRFYNIKAKIVPPPFPTYQYSVFHLDCKSFQSQERISELLPLADLG